MTGPRDITQLCLSSNLAGIVANKIEQGFYSVYSYSGIESIECALSVLEFVSEDITARFILYPVEIAGRC